MTSANALEATLAAVIEQALDKHVATSISLAVSFGDEPSIIVHRGHTQGLPTCPQSIYDLASLTKILGTIMAVAHALPHSELRLDDILYPQWPTATLSAILAHKAGFPAHLRFYDILGLSCRNFAQNRASIFDYLFALDAHESRATRLYSDLGFIALGHFLEKKFNKTLFEIFGDAWDHASLNNLFHWYPSRPPTFFNDDPHLAPTGFCPTRKQLVVGQVHDPNCYFMGGLEGHAGLFGTLESVDTIGRYFLRAYQEPTGRHEYILRHFAQHGLGFDKPTISGTTRYFSASAFGHFGYAGTALWIDPAWQRGKGAVITLLTNRVNCSERPEGIFCLRLKLNRILSSNTRD